MRNWRQLAVVSSSVIILGAAFSWWMVVRADMAMRGELLTQARLVAQALDLERVRSLTSRQGDLSSPDYVKVKAQLALIKTADRRCRFVYLFGRRPDGQIYFFADSEPAGSSVESPAGQTYDEAPAGFKRMFDTGVESVVGPATDRWGTWVSGLVPIARLGGSAPIVVLGMDIGARTWTREVIARAAMPVGLLVLLLASVGVAAGAFHQRKALKDSLANFRTFFETIDDMIGVAALDGRILFANNVFERKLGYGPGELAGMSVLDLYSVETRQEAEEIFAAALRGKGGSSLLPVCPKNGPPIPVETRIWRGRWNGLDCVFGICKDLSAEQEAQQRFEQLFRSNPTPMALTALPEQTFFDVNDAFLEKLGYQRSEIIGKTSQQLGLFVHSEQQTEQAERLRALGRVSGFDVQVRRKDGVILDGLFSGDVIQIRGQLYFLTVMVDVTDRNRAEEEKDRLRDQLQQAMKMEAIGRLAGGVAHDFNNLLTGITGNIELALLDLRPDDPLTEILRDVSDAANRAASLTRQLLAFSRKQVIEPKVLDLNHVVRDLRRMLVRLIGEDIELLTVAQPKLGSVKVDAGQIEQVLINLAINARDAMPNGGKLTIETSDVTLDERDGEDRPHSSPGDYVMLAMSDTGCGMTEEIQAHLFEPFFTTKEKGKGTGLGMATVYGAVKQSGGIIEVHSEPDHGTVVKIYLPRVETLPEPSAKAAPAGMATGHETVMLVEDEDTVKLLAEKVLGRQGYRVFAYPNGGEALAAIQFINETVDLLVTDVVMPGINGKMLADRVKAIRPEIKVLFTSGYPENAVAHHGVLDEGIEFLGKPYTPQMLAAKVRDVLDK
jgi:two-component system, cell cycle sensor histidine kinase and response regulator CckA